MPGHPALLQHLWSEYTQYLDEQLTLRRQHGQPATSLDAAKQRATAQHFLLWAEAYLKRHPASNATIIAIESGRPVYSVSLQGVSGLFGLTQPLLPPESSTVTDGGMITSGAVPVTG